MSRNFELMQLLTNEVPVAAGVATGAPPVRERARAEAYQKESSTLDEALQLVQRIFFVQAQDRPQTIVIAGINHGDGCSRTAAAVAKILTGYALGPVCLVEGNFRSPSLPALFGTSNHHGLADALLSDRPIVNFAKPLHLEKLWLLSAGALATDSPSLLTSTRLKKRFDELRKEFAFVIVDAPPLSRYADAITLGQLADGLVLILESGSTRREAAQLAVKSVNASNIRILGAVLNNRTYPIPEGLYRRL